MHATRREIIHQLGLLVFGPLKNARAALQQSREIIFAHTVFVEMLRDVRHVILRGDPLLIDLLEHRLAAGGPAARCAASVVVV